MGRAKLQLQTFEGVEAMSACESLSAIRESGLIAVMRGMEVKTCIQTAQALWKGGIRVLEITVDAPRAAEMIAQVSEALRGRALVGAGTVLDAEAAVAAIQAGAAFLFSPSLNREVIRAANRYGRVAIPGVMTPTEMVQAATAGAPAVKLFPASVVGPGFIKQVKGPLPHIPIIPTGGVDERNAAEYIRAGAMAVGIGGSLLGDSVQRGTFEEITARARRLVDLIREARG